MNIRRLIVKRQAIGLLMIAFAVGLSFQNCAPANFEMASEKSTDDGGYDLSTPNEEIVAKACQGTNIQTQTATIQFPRPQRVFNNSRCDWGNDGNGAKRNGYFQARLEQTQSVSLPANAKICDVKFSSVTQQWEYDDHVFVMMNDVLLAASHPIHKKLQPQNGLSIFEWSKIFEHNWDQIPAYVWCEGMADGQSACSWPASETSGTISMRFAPALFQKIMARDLTRSTHEFKFVTTGDNDGDDDCDHSNLSFDVEIKYSK